MATTLGLCHAVETRIALERKFIVWNKGADNWVVYITGDIPVGAYDKEFDAEHRSDGWNVWATLVISPAAQEQKPPEMKRPRIVK
jgi:hypothetical protein